MAHHPACAHTARCGVIDMSVPTWREAYESLSLSDRELLAQLHGVHVDALAHDLGQPGVWQRLYARQPMHTQALIQRVRRAGGRMPAVYVGAVAGPLRTNLGALSPRAFLTIYTPHSPLETAFINGLLWPVPRRDGGLDWAVLPDVERDLLPAPPLFAPQDVPDGTAAPGPAIDELLVGLALLVRGGGVVLGRGSKLPQRVLQLAHQYGCDEAMVRWFVAVCLAGRALQMGLHGLEVGPSMEDWLRAQPHLRMQEMLRSWLLAAWDDWQLAPDYRTRGVDMRAARRSMAYALLPHIPDTWIDMEDVCAAVRLHWPDIVRPVSLQRRWLPPVGWPDHWDTQDGAVLRLNMTGPLCWLGCVEWSADGVHIRRTAFGSWISGLTHIEEAKELESVSFESDFSFVLRDTRHLWARYQLEWLAERQDAVTWSMSPAQIQRAVAGGMSIDAIIDVIGRLTGVPIERAVRQPLALWAGSVAVVTISQGCLLKTQTASALDDLIHDRRVGVRDGRRLNETTYVIPVAERDRLIKNLRQAGYALNEEGAETAVLRDTELRLIEHALRAYHDTVATRALLHKIGLLRQSEQRHG